MLGFITNLNFTEMGIVLVGAIMVFGKDLPKVIMRGLQHLAKLRRAVTEMWREAGLEQEFKRVKAEIQPELTEIASARKSIQEGKDLLNGPVSNWRKNIGLELEDVVEVGSTAVDSTPTEVEPDSASEEGQEGPLDAESSEPQSPEKSGDPKESKPDPKPQ